jgi:hypothetical protein
VGKLNGFFLPRIRHPEDAELSVRDVPTRGAYRRSRLGRGVVLAGPGARLACAPRRIGGVFFLDSLLPRQPRSARGGIPHRRSDGS